MHRVWSRVVVAVSAAALGILAVLAAPASPAHAADELVKTSPQAGAKLDTAPRQVALTFSGTPQEDGTVIRVTGPDGKQATAGDPRFQDTSAIVAFKPTDVGKYVVDWKIVSSDGETATGTWDFTLTSTKQPASAAGSNSASAAGPVTISPLTQAAGIPWWIWAGVGATVVIAATAIIGNQTAQSAQLARRGRHEPRPGRYPNVDSTGY